MNNAAGTRPNCAIPPNTFSIFPYHGSALNVLFVMLSKVPSLSIFSMLCIFFTLLRTVLKFVSIPPNQRSVTNGMFTLRAHSLMISFACFCTYKQDLLPLRADLLHGGSSFLQALDSLVKVNNVNSFFSAKM